MSFISSPEKNHFIVPLEEAYSLKIKQSLHNSLHLNKSKGFFISVV